MRGCLDPQIAELSSDRAVMCAPISQGERIEEIASGLLACCLQNLRWQDCRWAA